MEFKIEKNIPVPNSNREIFHNTFSKMVVGDSFLLDTKKRTNVTSAISNFIRKNKDFKFTVRKTGNQLRIWRIK